MENKNLEKSYEEAAKIFDKYVDEFGYNTEIRDKAWIMKYLEDHGSKGDTYFSTSDLFYNRTTKPLGGTGNEFKENIHLFEYMGRNKYRILGPRYPYTGKVFRKRRSDNKDLCVGEWRDGKIIEWHPDKVME